MLAINLVQLQVTPSIFYKELSLDEGFAIADLAKNSRIVAGREVSLCSGIELFLTLRERQPIKCWKCHCIADRWISTRHPNDLRGKPCLNLFATRTHKPTKRYPNPTPMLVMMTRDHIIPKSLGGVDSVVNLRPGCDVCNGRRSSHMNKADTKFMLEHPELVNEERRLKGLLAAARATFEHQTAVARRQEDQSCASSSPTLTSPPGKP